MFDRLIIIKDDNFTACTETAVPGPCQTFAPIFTVSKKADGSLALVKIQPGFLSLHPHIKEPLTAEMINLALNGLSRTDDHVKTDMHKLFERFLSGTVPSGTTVRFDVTGEEKPGDTPAPASAAPAFS